MLVIKTVGAYYLELKCTKYIVQNAWEKGHIYSRTCTENENKLSHLHIFSFYQIFTCSKSTIATLEKKPEICSKLIVNTPGVFNAYFEHILHLFQVFLFLTLKFYLFAGNILISKNIPSYYLFKVSNRSTRKRCEICSKLTIKTPKRRRSSVIIVNLKHISHLFLVFLLLTMIK